MDCPHFFHQKYLALAKVEVLAKIYGRRSQASQELGSYTCDMYYGIQYDNNTG